MARDIWQGRQVLFTCHAILPGYKAGGRVLFCRMQVWTRKEKNDRPNKSNCLSGNFVT